ncbi:MAG: RnfH family protein [Pseudomonadota bacterium]|nr:RnfH family protein [Pseudomonadota bacterium]
MNAPQSSSDTTIRVQVVSAAPERAAVKYLELTPMSSVADALRLAALDAAFAGVDFATAPVGIFGRPVRPEQGLKDGDRIEIYRPLSADPKIARRARAREARKKT